MIVANQCRFFLCLRVATFMKLAAIEMAVQIAAPPFVATLMHFNNWYALGLSSILLVVAGFIASMLPETHPQHRETTSVSPNPVPRQATISGHNGEGQRAESYFCLVQMLVFRSYATSRYFVKSPGILLALVVFLLTAWGGHCWALLLQYVSQKFGWELSTVWPFRTH